MELSPQQQDALDKVNRWLKNPHDQVFSLFGYAGTGKTSIAIELASAVTGTVLFGAFTGKAASVMRQRGCPGATTIHKLIYLPKGKSRAKILDMQRRLEQYEKQEQDAPGTMTSAISGLKREIEQETDNVKRPAFTLNLDSHVRQADLLILDECSMINEQMGQDLISFGTKILVLGDPAQLPPVRGSGFFTTENPSAMLTEIHRQAEGNPIIELATKVRNGEKLEEGQYGDSRVMDWVDLDAEIARSHDQMIVGKNATRKGSNRRMREILGKGDATHCLPVSGDKLVCLKNNHDLGLLNGTQWTVQDSRDVDDHSVMLQVQDEDGYNVECLAHVAPFMGKQIPHWDHDKKIEEFDYGYAMTCHKAQGSQWGSVLVLDESRSFQAHRNKWLYTAITRAADRVTVAR